MIVIVKRMYVKAPPRSAPVLFTRTPRPSPQQRRRKTHLELVVLALPLLHHGVARVLAAAGADVRAVLLLRRRLIVCVECVFLGVAAIGGGFWRERECVYFWCV